MTSAQKNPVVAATTGEAQGINSPQQDSTPAAAKRLIEAFPCCNIKPGSKRPSGNAWQENPITPEQWAGAGVGVVCGPVEGFTTAVHGLDADIPHPEAAAAFKAWLDQYLAELGGMPLERVGKAPKFLVPFRFDDGEPLAKGEFTSKALWKDGIKGDNADKVQLEVLGAGNQFVAYATHPDTGKPYEWSGGQIHDIEPHELPALSRDNLAAIKAEFLRIMAEHGLAEDTLAVAKAAPAKPRANVSANDGGIIEKVVEAYRIGDILSGAGYTKTGTRWRCPDSSSGIPGVVLLTGDDGKERVYSHHGSDALANGYANDVFDVVVALEYGGAFSQAVRAEANKLDPEGQRQRQQEYMAANDAERKKLERDAASADAKAGRKAADDAEQEAATSDDLPPFPDDLIALPHGLGELQNYVYGTMIYPSPAAAGFTALAIYTSLAQSHLTINSMGGLGFNEQYMMLGGTGSGKEGTRKPFRYIHERLKRQVFNAGALPQILRSAPSSKQGLHKHLEDDNSLVMLSDEFGEWLCTTESGSPTQQALGYLMEIYSSALETVHPGGAVMNRYTPVKNPRVTLYTTSTAERMIETMTASQADSGSYNRFVYLPMGKTPSEKRYEGFEFEPCQRTMEPLEWLVAQSGTVYISPEAGERFKEQDMSVTEPIKHIDPPFGGRLGEQAIKLAGLVALSDKRTTISADDMDTAFALRVGLYKRTRALFAGEDAISDKHISVKAADQIRGRLEQKAVLYRSQLPAFSRAYRRLSVAEQNAVVVSLVEDGSMIQAEGSKARFESQLFDG
jgi:hypothetical protein